RLLHEEAAESPALLVGQDVAILQVEALTEVRIEDRRDQRVLAVVDDPEERKLRVGALGRRVAEFREEESGLPLAADRGREDRQERNERDLAHPERGVRAVDELVEGGGGGAERHRPVGRIAPARREPAFLDEIHALAAP